MNLHVLGNHDRAKKGGKKNLLLYFVFCFICE